ncbi:MAG: anti-CBASS protein Acb1 family protein [Microcoleus sp.]
MAMQQHVLTANSIFNLVTGAGTIGDGQSSYQLSGLFQSGWIAQTDLASNPTMYMILSKYVDGWSEKQFKIVDRKNREHPRLTEELRKILGDVREADFYSLTMGGAGLIRESAKDTEFTAIGSDELQPIDDFYSTYQYVGGLTGKTYNFSKDEIVLINGYIRSPSRRYRKHSRGWNISFVNYLEDAVTKYEAALYEILDSLRKANMLGMGLDGFGSIDTCNPETARAISGFIGDIVETINSANFLPYDKNLQAPGFLSRNLTGQPEIFAKAVDNLVAISGIPYSILMGMRSKSGLGNDSDESLSYYKLIDEYVEDRIIPAAHKAMLLLGIMPKGYTIGYDTLYSEDEKKVAEVEKINVEANSIRVNTVLQIAEKLVLEPARIEQMLGLVSESGEQPEGLQNLVINSAQTRPQLIENTANWLKGDEAYQLLMGTRIEP